MTRLLLTVFTLVACTSFVAAADNSSKPELAELHKKFTEQMKDVKLIGKFTIVGQNPEKLPDESYEISSAKKLPGSNTKWVITARIKYGKLDVNLPVPVNVEFAGDTPVISLTKATIPTLGTFSCRVVIYNGKYAGTWTHGKVSGYMFGKVEKSKKKE